MNFYFVRNNPPRYPDGSIDVWGYCRMLDQVFNQGLPPPRTADEWAEFDAAHFAGRDEPALIS